MDNVSLDLDALTVESFFTGEPEVGTAAAYCTGCMSTCGILPP